MGNHQFPCLIILCFHSCDRWTRGYHDQYQHQEQLHGILLQVDWFGSEEISIGLPMSANPFTSWKVTGFLGLSSSKKVIILGILIIASNWHSFPLTKYFYEHFPLSVCCCIVDQSKLVLHSWTSNVSSHTISSRSLSPIHMQSWLSTNTKTSASTSSTLLSWCMWCVSLHQYHLLLNGSCRNSFSRRMCLLVIWSTLWDILRNEEWTLARREHILKYDPPAEEIRADFFDMSTLKSDHHCSIWLYNVYEAWGILDVLHGYLTNGFITIGQKDNLN